MPAVLIDGASVARALREEIRRQVESLSAKGISPGLGVILVGDNPSSISYVAGKEKACKEMGIYTETLRMDAATRQDSILGALEELNHDEKFHGILVQLPLPDSIDEMRVIESILPEKDVDGFHPANLGRLMLGRPRFKPATPAGIVELLQRTGNSPEGKHVVIVGRSNIVGKPLANLLIQKSGGANATVTVCHTGTGNLGFHTSRADILVVAAGRPGTVNGSMIKPGAVVVDVGVNRIPDSSAKKGYRLIGDVDFESAREVASAITPVPGGVGPMTVTMLLKNTVDAAMLQSHEAGDGPRSRG
jgi:methylenetetrahydrofolate dehydrogenase (NADP+)/methenyltetrahydrofolate cyclohydrolase